MPSESVKQKFMNACNLSPHQFRMLELAASRETGMVSIKWYTMRTARALERKGFGDVRDRFEWDGWGMFGWCFVINKEGQQVIDSVAEERHER